MARPRKENSPHSSRRERSPREAIVRIIGGNFRGRQLHYHGDPRTRPMKDRTREAVFNLLGNEVRDKHVIDLFAGTGALGLEALSRGAARATLIERHFPTARLIEQNVATLDVGERVEVISADAFFWVERRLRDFQQLHERPWVVFCSPPYDFYVERSREMLAMLATLTETAPADSLFAVEADDRFDMRQLPQADRWQLRQYPPAVIAIL